MNRRKYLATAAGAITLTAGCLGEASNTIELDPIDPDPSTTTAGLAPDPIDVSERDVDESEFYEYNADGTTVNFVPLDVAVYWYHTRKARFVDARVEDRFETARIAGAIHSPAPDGNANDPLNDIGPQERIVAYCTCPHALSGLRGANLLNNGYSGVYGLDPGLEPWLTNDHPAAGDNIEVDLSDKEEDYSNVE